MIRVVVLWLLAAAVANAQNAGPGALLSSQQQAATLLERSIRAHGGERIENARAFDMSVELTNESIHQSREPEPPFGKWTVKARYVSDPARERFLSQSDASFPSFRNFTRTFSTRDGGWLIDYLAKTVVPETNLGGTQSVIARLLPQNLLLEARRRGATLRMAGADAISYVRPSGELYTLHFDPTSHLLTHLDALQANTLDGDVLFTHAYDGYRELDGLQVPSRYEVRRGPWTVSRAVITALTVNNLSADHDFVLPAYRKIASYDPVMQFETLAPGVHVVRYVPDGYNVLVVEFADHLAVVETPEGNVRAGLSEQVIAFIGRSLPGKAIRYAVATHHHSDHFGGIRGYAAAGATIITTPGNEAVAHSLLQRRSSIAPDALDRSKTVPRVEVLRGKKLVLKDASMELELHHIGPAPHVNNIIVAYIPKHRILFQTDLFNAWSCFREQVPNEDIGHTTALGDSQALLRAVEGLGLDVQTVIGGHGRDVRFAWLKAFTARRAEDGLPMWACSTEEMLPF